MTDTENNAEATRKQYASLLKVLGEVYDQVAFGKGKVRHATSVPFEEQGLVIRIRKWGIEGAFMQVDKKMQESLRLPPDKARAEIIGAIAHLAAVLVYHSIERETRV